MENNICNFIIKIHISVPVEKMSEGNLRFHALYLDGDYVTHNGDLSFGYYFLADAGIAAEDIPKPELTDGELMDIGAEYSLICNYKGLYYKINNDTRNTIRVLESERIIIIYSNGYCRIYKMGRKILKILAEFYLNKDENNNSILYNI